MKSLFYCHDSFVSNNTIQFIVDSNRQFLLLYGEAIKKNIKENCVSKNVSSDLLLQSLDEAVNSEAIFKTMFDDKFGLFRSSYTRKKYFKEQYNYVDFRDIDLGRNEYHEICKFYSRNFNCFL